MQKTDLKTSTWKAQTQISVSKCGGSAFFPGGSAARRFHVFTRRFRVFREGSALSRNSSTNQGRMGQNSIKTTRIDLNFAGRILRVLRRYLHPISSLSREIKEKWKSTGSWDLDQEIVRSASSWGIGWFPSMERLNLRHSSNQGNKNKPKWSRNKESKEELEEEGRSSWRTHQEHTNFFIRWTPEDTGGFGTSFPQRFMVLALIGGFMDLSLT
jgi:hypothetical protein